MQPIDVQQEFNRLSQAYRQMRDEELENVAAEAYNLTDVARECLAFEISSRGLKIPLNLELPPDDEQVEDLPPSNDGFVPHDEDILTVEIAEDMAGLMAAKSVLDAAHIECFLGEEKVHEPRELTSGFDRGVRVRVFRAEFERAQQLLRAGLPGYAERADTEAESVEVRCPKCHSDGVILDDREDASESGLSWRCDDCGYEWADDGVTS